MKEHEQRIIDEMKSLSSTGYGDYQFGETIVRVIDKVMGFEEYHFSHGRFASKEPEKVSGIIREMIEKGILIKSKSGTMYKLKRR